LNNDNIGLGKSPPEGNVFPVDAQVSWMHSSAVFVLISRPRSWRAEVTEHVFAITFPFAWRSFRYSGSCLYSPLNVFICLSQRLMPCNSTLPSALPTCWRRSHWCCGRIIFSRYRQSCSSA
jgi:hypothetical protein